MLVTNMNVCAKKFQISDYWKPFWWTMKCTTNGKKWSMVSKACFCPLVIKILLVGKLISRRKAMLTVKCRNNFIYSSLYGQLMLYMYNWNRSQESCMVLAIFRPYLSPWEEELCMYTFGDICNRMCSFFPRWYI